ncbi:MAG: hypothetical protein RQ885_06530 [Desulfurococcales archaeon]|nr:hypothetical protein [Desulfurococcales archaeon]
MEKQEAPHSPTARGVETRPAEKERRAKHQAPEHKLRISETRYKDLLGEADQHPRYLEKLWRELGIDLG